MIEYYKTLFETQAVQFAEYIPIIIGLIFVFSLLTHMLYGRDS